MEHNLETLDKVIEAMPIYGKLRKQNKLLKFGQYLTVLKLWFEKLRKEKENIEAEIHKPENYIVLPERTEIHYLNGETYTTKRRLVVISVKDVLGEK